MCHIPYKLHFFSKRARSNFLSHGPFINPHRVLGWNGSHTPGSFQIHPKPVQARCVIYNLQGFIHFSNSQRIVLYCHHNACLFNAWVSKTISSKDTYKRINCNEIRVKYMIDIR